MVKAGNVLKSRVKARVSNSKALLNDIKTRVDLSSRKSKGIVDIVNDAEKRFATANRMGLSGIGKGLKGKRPKLLK